MGRFKFMGTGGSSHQLAGGKGRAQAGWNFSCHSQAEFLLWERDRHNSKNDPQWPSPLYNHLPFEWERYHSHDDMMLPYMANGRLSGWAWSNHTRLLKAKSFLWLVAEEEDIFVCLFFGFWVLSFLEFYFIYEVRHLKRKCWLWIQSRPHAKAYRCSLGAEKSSHATARKKSEASVL